MNQLLLLSGNPKGRRRRGKRRSAAQRAATRKMLAANGNPRRRRRGRRHAVAHHRRRRGGRGLFAGLRGHSGGAMSLVKSGVIGGAGAVGVDILMGYAQPVIPAAMASRVNADGTMNFGYYGVKAAVALGIGLYGGRFLPAGIAPKIAEGALTVMSYEILRTFVPATMTMGRMGYFNPAPTSGGMGKILNVGSVGKIVSVPSGGAGTQVAQRLHALSRGR